MIHLSSEASSIEVFNMVGQLIKSSTNSNLINLDGLDKGVYFALLNKKHFVKVIKY